MLRLGLLNGHLLEWQEFRQILRESCRENPFVFFITYPSPNSETSMPQRFHRPILFQPSHGHRSPIPSVSSLVKSSKAPSFPPYPPFLHCPLPPGTRTPFAVKILVFMIFRFRSFLIASLLFPPRYLSIILDTLCSAGCHEL